MKKPLLTLLTGLLLLLQTALPQWAQAQTPAWIQEAYRSANYPHSEWYTGFSRSKLQQGSNVGAALKNLEKDAQNQLAESIIVNIDGETSVINTSEQIQVGSISYEQIQTGYIQAVSTATKATTVKSEVKSYHDPASNMLYAFAAVRRSDLSAYYIKQINNDLNKVDIALGTSEQLVAAGKKMSAYRQCQSVKKTLNGIAYYQDLLVAVNADADDNDKQTERTNDLHRTLTDALIRLEQSTFIYVDCKYEFKNNKDDAFNEDPNIICDIVKQSLSENDCSITDNKEECDYELTLTAYTTQRSDGKGQYGIISYYANVKGTLYNRLTKKQTVAFSIFNDADCYAAGKSAEDAATKAFKLPVLKDKVLEKILAKIKN